jgi:histone deacetylase complex regulatory component SIN3
LPPGYRININDDKKEGRNNQALEENTKKEKKEDKKEEKKEDKPIDLNSAIDYMLRVKEAIKKEYQNFIKVLTNFQNEVIGIEQTYEEISQLLKENQVRFEY